MRFAVALVGLILAGLVGAVLLLNQGTFTYALDDAYIHLDLADMLARQGLYGVNAGEYAAPSSSILWPFFLVPFAKAPLFPWMPLLLASLGALAATAVLFRIFAQLDTRQHPARWTALLTVLGAVGLNLPGLALTGLEHTTQIFLTLLVVLGLLRTYAGKTPAWWFWGALFLGPLIRYENAIVTLAALGVLLWLGYARRAFLCGLAVAVALGAFSVFLLHLDLFPLPASTVVKRYCLDDYWAFFGKALLPVFVNPLAMILFLLALVLPFVTLATIRQIRLPRWALLAALAGASVLHIFVGRFSGFGGAPRYEFYLFAFIAPLLWVRVKDRATLKTPFLILLGTASLTGFHSSLGSITRDAHSVYLQQYQMGRLVHDFVQEPVAANDVGLIGFRNPAYVLDLVGLSNNEVLHVRRSDSLDWTAPLIRKHDSSLILIYTDWFPLHDTMPWISLGKLVCTACSVVVPQDQVLILTPRPERAEALRARLKAWAGTLPRGAVFVPSDDTRAAHEAVQQMRQETQER